MEFSIERLLDEQVILLKEYESLETRLSIIRAKIEFAKKYSLLEQKVISEPSSSSKNESETNPEQTATGKGISTPLKAVVLLKSQNVRKEDFPEQQKVISSPSSEMNQDEANPEQTAPGKDSTNPLKAVNLPKIQNEVQTSTTLDKFSDLSLRPNGGIQIPNKTNEESLERLNSQMDIQNPKNYYVVFNGPNAGIYNNWSIASLAIIGISGVSYKRFKNFQEARISANLYTTEMMKPPIRLINTAEGLKPTYQQALKRTDKPMTVLGMKSTSNLVINNEEDNGDTIYDSFQYFYELGRTATEEHFVEHRFFTSDKNNISYFNYYPNANKEMIYEAFVNGLVSNIYPSKNLLELSEFPKGIRETIRKFRTKCLKNSDKEIFVKVQSTVPFWDEDYGLVKPFHYIQIGIVKEKFYNPSKSMPVSLKKEDLQQLAFHKYASIMEKVLSLHKEEKIKVNYASNNCLIISQTHQKMTPEEKNALSNIQRKMMNGREMFGAHYPSLCKDMNRIIKKAEFSAELLCPFCPDSKEKRTTADAKDKAMADNKTTTTLSENKAFGKRIVETNIVENSTTTPEDKGDYSPF